MGFLKNFRRSGGAEVPYQLSEEEKETAARDKAIRGAIITWAGNQPTVYTDKFKSEALSAIRKKIKPNQDVGEFVKQYLDHIVNTSSSKVKDRSRPQQG